MDDSQPAAPLPAVLGPAAEHEERAHVEKLAQSIGLGPAQRARVVQDAAALVRRVRGTSQPTLMESFLAEYGLSTAEGIALMTLAEAMLRVPDVPTTDALVADKVVSADWNAHTGHSPSQLVNASTWALALTRRMLADDDGGAHSLVKRLGEPVVRRAIEQAMRELGRQFVLGRDIEEAVERAARLEARGYAYSYDMLGEAARTARDAERYMAAYAAAIDAIAAGESGKQDEVHGRAAIAARPGISVKLSALHPRYETLAHRRVLAELAPRLARLARSAREANIGLNVDAEESERLELSLHVIEQVLSDAFFAGWDGFGVVVQSYGRRAMNVVQWLVDLAARLDRRIMVRLVKGAYWDTEIKRAQVLGVESYPVFTRKSYTDVSYLACARLLLANAGRMYPQFATHNAHTAQAVLALAGMHGVDVADGFEFQRLHGMGEALHEGLRAANGTRCRIYAPVGPHRDLLAYLVRRLLENGANSSFVNQIADERIAPETVARDPVDAAQVPREPRFPQPPALYGPARRNAAGWDAYDPAALARLQADAARLRTASWRAAPLVAGDSRPLVESAFETVRNPADPDDVVGKVRAATRDEVDAALGAARGGFAEWSAMDPAARANALRAAAERYERHALELFSLAEREAGKTIVDQIAEVREAVDFLRYYANAAEQLGDELPARGVIACISPWNFPLAIFTGQVAAALGAGNAVIAKPAEQTPLMAARAVALMREAGVPDSALQLLPGAGNEVGAALVSSHDIDGVCFTGSFATARRIDRALAANAHAHAMFIAETGGLNAMIVDSTALLEQAVRDIVTSSFQSAGQRCSALRMLYVQSDVYAPLVEMLRGAMRELEVGPPARARTDIGPLIDGEASDRVLAHVEAWARRGGLLERLRAPETGFFVPPALIEVDGIEDLEDEIFGPVLHVARFDADDLDQVIDAINAKGYGLTFGLHTRLGDRADYVAGRAHAGNVYINRNQIGAVVGTQPFGGEGLSGTGPKAGGPSYVERFKKRQPRDAGTFDGNTLGADELNGLLGALSAREDTRAWASLEQTARIERISLRIGVPRAAHLSHLPGECVEMPGPTGERNTLRRAPRGVALCLGPGAEAAFEQATTALAAGNAVLAVAAGAPGELTPMLAPDLPVQAIDGQVDIGALRLCAPLDLVLCSAKGDPARRIRQAIATRDGPLIPVVEDPHDCARLSHERHVCIDTTAAGGNASLLAPEDED